MYYKKALSIFLLSIYYKPLQHSTKCHTCSKVHVLHVIEVHKKTLKKL